jgi:soluble lytic murein transglycosylase-like protein
MVAARNYTKTLAPILSVLAALCSTPSPAEPVDWASSGGDLFVTASLSSRDFMIDRPTVPQPTRARQPIAPSRIVAAQASPAQQTAHPSPSDPLPTDDYGEVRLLPSNQPLDTLISKIAIETGLDPKLLHALVIIESAYNVRAVSPVGARGLTQLMPGTAAELGVRDVYDTEQNLRAGARYLAIQIGRFSDIRLALAAYNSGPNRVARLGRVPDISETQNYVRDGIDCYLALTAGRGIRNRSQCRTTGRR